MAVRTEIAVAIVVLLGAVPLAAQDTAGGRAARDTAAVRELHDSVTVRFVDTDLRAAVQALGGYLPKPVIVGGIPPARVSLQTPAPVPRAEVGTLLRGLVESQGLQLVEDSAYFEVRPKPPAVLGPAPGAGVGQASSAPVQLFVIRLKHARAPDVAATVNQLFGGAGDFAGGSGLATGTLSDELRRNRMPPAGAPVPAPQPTSSVAPGATLSGPVVIVPDERTNSLLVHASQADFDVLKAAVDQLDIRPLQVLIEVLIVETERTSNFGFGASFTLPPQGLDHTGGTVDASTTGASLGDFVLHLLNVGHAQVSAAISAAASRGDVKIVSRPVLLASNNTEASIMVGSQQPFVQVSRTLPTDTPSIDQVVQYEDVGTKLTVRPTIDQDGYVSLVIHQEVSQATAVTQFNAPVISTREASTQVLVKDGQTIVLGGMRDIEADATQGGVPLLSSIPILGGLFGSANRTHNDTQFYLFLTPRILKTDADADSVTAPRLPARAEP
jgi:general secretion pathway protein D